MSSKASVASVTKPAGPGDERAQLALGRVGVRGEVAQLVDHVLDLLGLGLAGLHEQQRGAAVLGDRRRALVGAGGDVRFAELALELAGSMQTGPLNGLTTSCRFSIVSEVHIAFASAAIRPLSAFVRPPSRW